MNIDLIKLNENCGITTDENGNTIVISKDQSETSFEEILLKENAIESLKNDLNISYFRYDMIKYYLKAGRWYNTIVLLGILFLGYVLLNKSMPIDISLIICGGTAVFCKLISLPATSGLVVINKRKLKKLRPKIDELKSKIPELEKELSDIKEKVKYTALSNDSPKTYNQELLFADMLTPTEEKGADKVKILKLTKNK